LSLLLSEHRVTLKLAGEEVLVAESYEIALSIFEVPAAFAIRLGHRDVLAGLMKKCPPNTPFQLLINNVPQFTGRTDGYTGSSGDGGSTLTLRGRDTMAALNDAFATTERSFANTTFADLVKAGIAESYGGIDKEPDLFFDNAANRQAIAGVPVKQTKPPAIEGVDPEVLSPSVQQKTLQVKLGQRWFPDVIKPELDRAGLFLWAGGNGEFVLSTPNTSQEPTARIVRRVGVESTISAEFRNEPTTRYSRCDVHCRSGGGSKARTKSVGTYEDAEMIAWGYDRPCVIKDDVAKSIAQARRAGWSLTYTVPGHTTPSLTNGAPAVWVPDIMVEVDDEEFDLRGNFYCCDVRHNGGAPKLTTVTLMRPEDVVFGTDPAL
jgi:prophage tail gpP-like protein